MTKLGKSRFMKGLCCLLFTVLATMTLLGGVVCVVCWDALVAGKTATVYGLDFGLTFDMPVVACGTVGGLLLTLALGIYLTLAVGHRNGKEGIQRSWIDVIPLELYLILMVAAVAIAGLPIYMGNSFLSSSGAFVQLVVAIASVWLISVVLLTAYLSLVVRCKGHTLLRNSIIGRIFGWLKGFIVAWPVAKRPVLTFVIYLIGTAITARYWLLAPFYQGAVAYCIYCWWRDWKVIQKATSRILEGERDVTVYTGRIFPPLRPQAQALGNLSTTIDKAVEERMKSEHFRAELITNVSHDLKTPLTSIINYVDLLKKEELHNETAEGYIEVLDRKSQHLKKLTEDLVEVSKATTGTTAVHKERMDLGQLVTQATGEYEDKLTAAGLTLRCQLPENPLYVEADGRHLWRILDNLLSNCAKYAMAGTRVYVDVVNQDGQAVVIVKNISRTPINMTSEELLGRFVRGDEARSTEGFGLGLSIAQSLTALQGGTFQLELDGDLFKVSVGFLEVKREKSTND